MKEIGSANPFQKQILLCVLHVLDPKNQNIWPPFPEIQTSPTQQPICPWVGGFESEDPQFANQYSQIPIAIAEL